MAQTPRRAEARRSDVGLLLVGHGSRANVGVDEFLATARLVARRTAESMVEPCFLEFARPTIGEGFAALARQGARRVVVAPAILFAAAHIRRDIPAAVCDAAAAFPGVETRQAEHLGCHAAIVELSRMRFDEALAGRPAVPSDQTMLVLVGRGSHDADATAELLALAHLRAAESRAESVETGFLAMAEPRLEDVLERIAYSGARRVVVQPHLLFGGVLLERIGTIVDRFARQHPDVEWLVTAHLGPADLVAQAVESRAATALANWDAQTTGDACRT